jgi:hypothetical protein
MGAAKIRNPDADMKKRCDFLAIAHLFVIFV